MIGKNKRAEHSSLQVKGTLSSIMTVKLADLNAKTFTPPASMLKAAKSATYEYKKAHKYHARTSNGSKGEIYTTTTMTTAMSR